MCSFQFPGTIFAYGQTSSGKTHTMMGSEEEPGIIKQALTEIFNTIENVSVSVEMYFNPRGIQIYTKVQELITNHTFIFIYRHRQGNS